MASNEESGKILIIEPFFGGSHKQMLETLLKAIPSDKVTMITLTPRKWHWRARCSGLIVYNLLPKDLSQYKVLFCTSVLPLAELVGMRPDLKNLKKVVYFHENQLVYPKQTIKDRDYQYGYNQLTSCIAADKVLFNSRFNQDSFLGNIDKFLKMMPDNRPKDIKDEIALKCDVLYYLMDFKQLDEYKRQNSPQVSPLGKLCIVWPHRWEFDKNPKQFLNVLKRLKNKKLDFEVVILGESFGEVPEEFQTIVEDLKDHLKYMGYAETRELYYQYLSTSHVVVSTADHEFFGVSMLEGVRLGCYPLVPRRLVYTEIYPRECLYNDEDNLVAKLSAFCTDKEGFLALKDAFNMKMDKYDAVNLIPQYLSVLTTN